MMRPAHGQKPLALSDSLNRVSSDSDSSEGLSKGVLSFRRGVTWCQLPLSTRPFKATILTFPWDLADEGLDRALDNIQHTAGLTEVVLAVSFNAATFFLPHNPERKLYFGEDGVVFFEPDLTKYTQTAIRPRVSELVTGPDYLRAPAERIRGRGLGLTTWIVYAPNQYLARTYPQWTTQDALGNSYPSHLCISALDVRSYHLALTEDVVEQFGPDAVYIENVNFLPFGASFFNPLLLSKMTPWDQFLMGLCMCSSCITRASENGFDASEFRQEVATYLETSLPRLPSKDELEAPVGDDQTSEAFNGRLQSYIDARTDTASSLFEDVVDKVKSRGDIKIRTGPLSALEVPVYGLSPPRVAPLIDQMEVGHDPETISREKRAQPSTAIFGGAVPTSYPTQDDLVNSLREQKEAGAAGFGIFNYGLMREEHMRWIGAARSLWST